MTTLIKVLWSGIALLICVLFFKQSISNFNSFSKRYKNRCQYYAQKGFASLSPLFILCILAFTGSFMTLLRSLPSCPKGFGELEELLWLSLLIGISLTSLNIQALVYEGIMT